MHKFSQSMFAGLASFFVMIATLQISTASTWWFHEPKLPQK